MAAGKMSLFLAALLLVAGIANGADQDCEKLVGGLNTTVLMVADPGDFTGSAEAKWYLANLENPTYVPSGSTICVSRAYGTIMGQNVTVVSSGINPQSSALCTMELLSCASHIKDFIYTGTAGFSPAVGGVINPPDCMEVASTSDIVRIGDVCVSPFANNWECRLASWNEQCNGFPNQCSAPMLVDDLTVSSLYGQCSFDSYDQASIDLADEIMMSTKSNAATISSLRGNAALANYENNYWMAMTNGTGENFMGAYNSLGGPKVFDYNVCAETDGQFFWSGAPWDYNARTYVAYTLSQALNTTLTAEEVLAVSAMEAVGVALAMQKFSAIPGNPKIPYVFVRGASDYVHLPLSNEGNGVWDQIDSVPPVDFINGYAYAIASYSTVVLDMLASRCMAANSGSSASCTMKAGGVTYSTS